MTVLVGYAKNHGSTWGIPEEIGDQLAKAGFRASVQPLSDVHTVNLYEAVVLGVALGHEEWLSAATRFLDWHASQLSGMPLWLFSESTDSRSGSILGPLGPRVRSVDTGDRIFAPTPHSLQLRGQHHFECAAKPSQWQQMGELFLKLCGGTVFDSRDFRDVDDWSRSIARELQTLDRARERRRLRLVPRVR